MNTEGEPVQLDHDPVASAWNIHAAIIDWIKNVDSKASFVSAIESGLLLGVVTFTGDSHQLTDLEGRWELMLFWIGVTLLVGSLLLVLSVVAPHLRGRSLASECHENFVYFGHARYWRAEELASALQSRDLLPVLSRQIVATSAIAWSKHRKLQLSIYGAAVASALIGLAALVNYKT